MKKSNKVKIVLASLVVLIVTTLSACVQEREVDNVSYNISQEADNFNIVRQLTVINCIQGDTLFQMTGKFSIKADVTENQLEVTVEEENGNHRKHFIGLSSNVTYIVEQVSDKYVSKYAYELNYNPKMWIPLKLKNID